MLTEVVVAKAVKSALGFGFDRLISSVFRANQGKSDDQILAAIAQALVEHGQKLDSIEARLATLEGVLRLLITRLTETGALVRAVEVTSRAQARLSIAPSAESNHRQPRGHAPEREPSPAKRNLTIGNRSGSPLPSVVGHGVEREADDFYAAR
jgi:hypothetical protein